MIVFFQRAAFEEEEDVGSEVARREDAKEEAMERAEREMYRSAGAGVGTGSVTGGGRNKSVGHYRYRHRYHPHLSE